MAGQEIIKCKQCDSNKVQVMPIVLIMVASGGCLVWIPVIGWIAAPIIFLIALIMMFVKGKFMKCNECNHVFNVDKATYKEYKSKLYS